MSLKKEIEKLVAAKLTNLRANNAKKLDAEKERADRLGGHLKNVAPIIKDICDAIGEDNVMCYIGEQEILIWMDEIQRPLENYDLRHESSRSHPRRRNMYCSIKASDTFMEDPEDFSTEESILCYYMTSYSLLKKPPNLCHAYYRTVEELAELLCEEVTSQIALFSFKKEEEKLLKEETLLTPDEKLRSIFGESYRKTT